MKRDEDEGYGRVDHMCFQFDRDLSSHVTDNPLILPESQESNGVLTKERRALILSKREDVVYMFSDEAALQGLIKQIVFHKVV